MGEDQRGRRRLCCSRLCFLFLDGAPSAEPEKYPYR